MATQKKYFSKRYQIYSKQLQSVVYCIYNIIRIYIYYKLQLCAPPKSNINLRMIDYRLIININFTLSG